MLLISDPKALQYIFHTSGYNFLKWPERTEISRVLMGRGLLWSDGMMLLQFNMSLFSHQSPGEVHRRQRKVMLPGFGGTAPCSDASRSPPNIILAPEAKSYVPIFRQVADQVSNCIPVPAPVSETAISSQAVC